MKQDLVLVIYVDYCCCAVVKIVQGVVQDSSIC